MDSGLKNQNKRLRTTHHPDNYPDDRLLLIYETLETKHDRDSFGLTCHNFLDIQSSSRKHLRVCSLINCHATNFLVFNMLNRFRNLDSLSLICCRGLLNSGLANLLLYRSTLQSLNLSYCSRVTDLGLSYVASGCPFLSAVNLKKCSSITNHRLQILAESCKSLKLVHLNGRSTVTDHGIRIWAKLKILDLKMCGDLVDDATILKIAKGCPLLQEWNLSYCYKIAISG
ncbi:F-box/LRR-repeat protein 12 [Artemisia annua]|uniref:F-box/LRR-repeat protein 12 n=1 Tax=Artemisia annua TaxID=35608 RepID=A0A2U1KM97_ARTAN|nr:F-box/LRR-repeat protein 12 [Artemisia annua]